MDRSPAYWREHYQLDVMELGGRVPVRAGHVVRVRPREYCLHHETTRSRARWGTAEQIAEDIAYMEQYGTLPPANGSPW